MRQTQLITFLSFTKTFRIKKGNYLRYSHECAPSSLYQDNLCS